jgi:hypothetical protein
MMDKSIQTALETNNTVFKKELRVEFKEMLMQNNIDLKRDIRDEVHALIAASEKRIIHTITGFIDQAILPQIHDLQTDTQLVKQHLKLA